MNKDEKKTETNPTSNDTAGEWAFIIVMLFLCITMVFTTRMYVDGHLIDKMVDHYTLRGKDVIVENQQLVFINN